MSALLSRRHLLSATLGLAAAGSARAIGPIRRPGSGRLSLGLAAYSFRDHFEWLRDKRQPGKEGRAPWSVFDFVDWCADHGVAGAELTSYFFPPDADEAFCREVRRRAHLRGVTICGTAVGNTFTHPAGAARDREIAGVRRWIDLAAALGAPHIRVFAGNRQKDQTEEEAFAACRDAYAECLVHAAARGVFLGLENHGGIVAEPAPLIRLVEAVDSPWAGVNFDSGNFHGEDPYAELAQIAPYSVNVQLKVEIRRKGAAAAEATDIDRVLRLLREANYQGWFTLEYERADDPFTAIPPILADLRKRLG